MNVCYTNQELWQLAEKGELIPGQTLVDRHGVEIVWTGRSFQTTHSRLRSILDIFNNKYYGMTLMDEWRLL